MTEIETVWFDRKPRQLEAIQFTPASRKEAEQIAEWCGGEFCYYVMEPGKRDNWFISLRRHGFTSVNYGDWVVRDYEDHYISMTTKQLEDEYMRSQP